MSKGFYTSCVEAKVNPDVLGQDAMVLPGGIEVAFANHIAGDYHDYKAYHYASDMVDVIITYNPSTGAMHAHAVLPKGESFTLEYCGRQGHVWKEIDVATLGKNEGVDYISTKANELRPDLKELVARGQQDNITGIEYSVKIYYTPDFAATTPDIPGFVNQMIMETNQGYINSKVPLGQNYIV